VRRRVLAAAVGVLAIAAGTAPAAAAPGPPNAPEYWFDSWHVPSLWKSGARGQGITIAEIDTGVSAGVPELAGRVLRGTDFGEGGDGRVDREINAFGHGTAMASIMVARPGLLGITGLAPGAKILPIAVPLTGTTDADQPDKLPEAIRYAADHHAKIISMSLGGKRSPRFDSQPCNADEQAAIYYALRKGAMVLASVGNTGPKKNTIEDPAVCLGVVSVGAVDASGTVANFSSRAPYLTLVAPGVDVPSLGRVPGEAFAGDGTSQATAITSAAAALVWSKFPALSARQVVTRLVATLGDRRTKPSRAYGYGRLDPYRAVTGTVPAGAANPVFDAVAPFLDRDARLRQDTARPAPARAAPGARSTGTYAVGTAPRFTGKVIGGASVAGAGLVLLLALLAGGVRGRRRRLRPVSGQSGPEWSVASDHSVPNQPLNGGTAGGDAPAGINPPDEPRRPRPGPRPPSA
jgi:subtilisin family serine protease